MNKFVSAIIGIAIAAGVGYYMYEMSQPEDMMKDDSMMEDDAMMKDDTKKDDAMMEGDAMMKKDEDGVMVEGDAMMKKDDTMMKSEDSMMKDDAAMMKTEGAAYVAYKDGVIGNGESSVLFFHAAWCPSCKKADTELQEIYSAGGVKLTTYKVDYDTQTELKKKYGVTYQHTFVVIDGNGNAVKTVTGPTAVQIAALVK